MAQRITPASPTVVPPRPEDATLAALVASATRDVQTLVHGEIELAKAELRQSAMLGARGGAMFAVAGFLGFLASILLSIAAAYGLTALFDLPLGWSFAIVAGVYLLLAGILALVGVLALRKIKGPERTIATAKEIPEALKPSR
jgi:Putative Actinobacterial Holin-X, holin superfamily III